jgi:formate C-acetyltransferase
MTRGEERNAGWLRDYTYMRGWMAAEDQPLPMRNAAALAEVIENMPVRLADGDLLAGEHGNNHAMLNFTARLPADIDERIAASPLDDSQKRDAAAWLAREPFRWQLLAPVAPKPPELELAERHGVATVWGTDLNHSIRAYDKVLRLGFLGLRGEVTDALAALKPADPDAPQRRANLLAWLRLCDAAVTLGERHAAAARERAAGCADPTERREWEAIAEVCDRVPALPARTFREALQGLWFAHMITVWEDGVNANGIGRIDQILWPYYQRDLAEGRLAPGEAAELLAALWVKLYQSYDVQQMMVGGQLPDGSDATNALSYLALDVTEGLDFVRCLSARLHRRSPRAFVARCADLIARGGGIPFFFNDEALVPALVDKGVPIEDARGYAAIGCIEITLPGQANPHAVSHWINTAKVLELALNDGKDLLDGAQVGPRTGTLDEFETMDDVLAAYTKQLEHVAQWCVYGSNAAEIAHRSQYRLPYLSLLTDDCVARGFDILEGGARYNYHSSAAMAIPNAADSLAALQSAVFDQRRVDRRELLDALAANFAGREDLRLMLRNRAPKYGNDQPLPDSYAARLTRQYCELMSRFRTAGGGAFHAHLFTFTLMVPFGKLTAASPDGRRAGEPLAYSVSPGQGRDTSGFTAVVQSLSRIPHHLAAASSSAILEVDPALVEAEGRSALVDLLVTAIDLGVGQMQFNVVSAETLRAAQADPERYRNLCVRVSGFSQQFCLLDRELQEHIIARTKHRR